MFVFIAENMVSEIKQCMTAQTAEDNPCEDRIDMLLHQIYKYSSSQFTTKFRENTGNI